MSQIYQIYGFALNLIIIANVFSQQGDLRLVTQAREIKSHRFSVSGQKFEITFPAGDTLKSSKEINKGNDGRAGSILALNFGQHYNKIILNEILFNTVESCGAFAEKVRDYDEGGDLFPDYWYSPDKFLAQKFALHARIDTLNFKVHTSSKEAKNYLFTCGYDESGGVYDAIVISFVRDLRIFFHFNLFGECESLIPMIHELMSKISVNELNTRLIDSTRINAMLMKQLPGYRLAKPTDFSEDIRKLSYANTISAYQADFNSDGSADWALMVINTATKEYRIYYVLNIKDQHTLDLLFSVNWEQEKEPIRNPMFFKKKGDKGLAKRMYNTIMGTDFDPTDYEAWKDESIVAEYRKRVSQYTDVPAIIFWTGAQRRLDPEYCSETWYYVASELKSFDACD